VKRVAEYFGFIFVILLITVAALTYLAPHFGWRVDAVGSGSMEPQLKVGALLVASPVEPEAVAVGDIIIFQPTTVGENPICHRVIGIIEEGSSLYFKTKGDASDDPDPFIVPARNVVGRIWFHVPFLGYVTEFLKTPFGLLLALVIPGLTIIAMDIRSICETLTKGRKERQVKVVSR